jgi:enamine deaminase RidA (YjgF/YER057c/UK114 family)
MTKRTIYTGKPIDRRYQYAPGVVAVRAGLVFVSGMVGWNESGHIVEPDDVGAQARRAFENLRDVLAAAGAGLRDVVMETEYVLDMAEYRTIGRVRSEFFPEDFPAATVVEVGRLFKPELRFEIQAVAVVPGADQADR